MKMRVNFQLCLLCICAAVALVVSEGLTPHEWFKESNIDGDNVLSFEEVFLIPREEVKWLSPELAHNITAQFDASDKNGDGEITIDEFLNWDMNPEISRELKEEEMQDLAHNVAVHA